MAEQVKFTDEEMNKIRSLNQKYANITIRLGQCELQRLTLEVERESIKQVLSDIQIEEKNLGIELKQKYGDGALNPETGMFTKKEQLEQSSI